MITEQRTYESFRWIEFKRSTLKMLGFGFSSDWLSTRPWSFDGEPRPYIGLIQENKSKLSSEKFRWWILYLGPILVQIIYQPKDTQ